MLYEVYGEMTVSVGCRVEADDADEAMDKAADLIKVSSFVGNGGSNKLIGVTGQHNWISAEDTDIDIKGAEEAS